MNLVFYANSLMTEKVRPHNNSMPAAFIFGEALIGVGKELTGLT